MKIPERYASYPLFRKRFEALPPEYQELLLRRLARAEALRREKFPQYFRDKD